MINLTLTILPFSDLIFMWWAVFRQILLVESIIFLTLDCVLCTGGGVWPPMHQRGRRRCAWARSYLTFAFALHKFILKLSAVFEQKRY